MGTIKATNIEPIADNGTITLGSSGDTFSLGSGVNNQLLRPSFSVTMGSEQSLTQNTYTKVIFDTEVFDTDSAYDTSTGRFTCPTGKDGKYFFTSTISMNASYAYVQVDFYKNGSSIYRGTAINTSTSATNINAVIDLSASDYVEVYCKQNQTNNAEGGNNHVHFHGYRIGT